MDKDGLCPIIYAKNYDYYKIPGGGIDDGEDFIQAAKRESLEECGCEVEILGEVGRIEENKSADNNRNKSNMTQVSYCFYGKIISKGDTGFTGDEIKEGFKLLWLSYEDAIKKFQSANPQHKGGVIMNTRDMIFLQEGYKVLKDYL